MKCHACGAENTPGAKFCSQCGERLTSGVAEAWLRCDRCGHDNPPGSRFCGECGAPLAPAAPVAPRVEASASSAEPPRPMPASIPEPTLPAQPAPPPPAAEPPPFYFVSSSGAPIHFPPRPDKVWLIGREDPVSGIYPDVDLSPYDPERTVSRRHAEIAQAGSTVVLTSLTTTNWTKVNNVKIPSHRPVVLREGDQIEFARCVVTFHMR